MKSRPDVVVVGGGISGLAAARSLQAAGISVVVLEARNRFGGRTCTELGDDGDYHDMGGSYVGPTQNRVLALAKDLKVRTRPIYIAGTNIMHINNRRSTYSGTIPSLGVTSLLDLNYAFRTHEALRKKIPRQEPWKAPKAKWLDDMTVQEWINRNCWTKDATALIRAAIAPIYGAEPSEVSLLHWLWYLNSGHGIKRLIDAENGAQERKFIGGSQQISTKIAEELGSDARLSSVVSDIIHDAKEESPYKVTVRCVSGPTLQCRYVIVAIAPPLYQRIRFDPPLPAMKQQLSQRMPMGSVIKTVLTYTTPFWRVAGFSGTILTDEGPVIYTYDDGDLEGKSTGKIMGFVLAKDARSWGTKSKEQRRVAICSQYARLFHDDRFLTPSAYIEKNWMEEEFSSGCPIAFGPPRLLTEYGMYLRTPFERVHFAGTETATRWAGYMDGAVQAGERAAHEVLTRVAGELTHLVKPGEFQEEKLRDPDSEVTERPSAITQLEKTLPSLNGLLCFFFVMCLAWIVQQKIIRFSFF